MGENKTDGCVSNEAIYALLKTVSQQNAEIKEDLALLRTQIGSLDGELLSIKQENILLKEETSALKDKVRLLERASRENNLVIYNLNVPDTAKLSELVVRFFESILDIKLQPWDINNVTLLGKSATSSKTPPVLLKLTSALKKREIFRALNKLKGSGYSISEDLSREERARRKVIYENYKSAKVKGYPVQLFKNSVIINGKKYKYEDLKNCQLEAGPEENTATTSRRVSYSAPASPSRGDSYHIAADNLPRQGVFAVGSSDGSSLNDRDQVNTRSRTGSKSSTSSQDRIKNKAVAPSVERTSNRTKSNTK